MCGRVGVRLNVVVLSHASASPCLEDELPFAGEGCMRPRGCYRSIDDLDPRLGRAAPLHLERAFIPLPSSSLSTSTCLSCIDSPSFPILL